MTKSSPTDHERASWSGLRPTRRKNRIASLVALGFVLLLALESVLVWNASTGAKREIDKAQRATDALLPAVVDSLELQAVVQARMVYVLRMLAQLDPFERINDARAFEAQRMVFEKEVRELEELLGDDASREQLRQAIGAVDQLSRVQVPMVEALLLGEDDVARDRAAQHGLFERQKRAHEAMAALADAQERRLHDELEQMRGEMLAERRATLLTGALLAVTSIGIGVLVTWSAARAASALERDKRVAETLALVDPLTGLLNRRGLQRELARWFRPGRAAAATHSVLVIDLDGFKQVNDRAGHDAGDELLRGVSEAMIRLTRPSDRIARTGGDEFVILLDGMNRTGAMGVAQRLLEAIHAFELPWRGDRLRVGASIGVATLDPARQLQGCTAALQAADAACYCAKRQGRGRVVVAQEASLA